MWLETSRVQESPQSEPLSNEAWIQESRKNIKERFNTWNNKENVPFLINFLTSLKDYQSMAQSYRWLDETQFVDEFIFKIKESSKLKEIVDIISNILAEVKLVRETVKELSQDIESKKRPVAFSELDSWKVKILFNSSLSGLFVWLEQSDDCWKILTEQNWPVSRLPWLEKMYNEILEKLKNK